MIFGKQMPLNIVAVWCRSLSTLLHSGVALIRALELAGKRAGDQRFGPVTQRLIQEVRTGNGLSEALIAEGSTFPALLVDMVSVGEQTGNLPEVLTSLAGHFDHQVQMRRTFIAAITWPVLQAVAAILIVAILIVVLGVVAQVTGSSALDVLGVGLTGTTGAVAWLSGWAMLLVAGYIGWEMINRMGQRGAFDRLLLTIPVVGHCLRSFALSRFSWAFAITQNSGMMIGPSISASLKASGNAAFAATAPEINAMVMSGEELSDALQATGYFPTDYLEMIRVGESSGTVPEVLERMAPQLDDDARRSLAQLTMAFSSVIWAAVAIMIIVLIFRVFSIYLGLINGALKDI
jgi:type IV pilus assembly protein PilC